MNYYYRAVVKLSNRGLVRGYKKVWGSLIYSIVLWRSNEIFITCLPKAVASGVFKERRARHLSRAPLFLRPPLQVLRA